MKKTGQGRVFGSLKIMACASLLSAMSIIFGKLLAVNLTPTIRISLGNLPIILSGILFGPVTGACVGTISDLVGCLIAGYAINPLITVGSGAIGLFSGIVSLLLMKKSLGVRVVSSVAVSNIIGSVIIKTLAFYVFYGSPILITGVWRFISCLIIGTAESFLIYLLMKNVGFMRQIESIKPKRNDGKRGGNKMTYDEALQYIHSVCWKGSRPGLERITELTKKLGNPQDDLKFIHVAGTNGKGSFCAMIANVLKSAGLKVGLFTSPYVLRFNERMKINGEDIPNDRLASLTERVKAVAEKMSDVPTEFELITAIALEYFREEACDVVVFECGMGGRLDSTNVIKTPVLSVITGISLDHTAILGDTVEKIAREKAGIIKNGCPVLFCSDNKDAEAVIRKKAEECHSEYFCVDRSKSQIIDTSLDGTCFDFCDYKNVKIPLLGTYQPQNACNVLTAVDILKGVGFNIPVRAIYDGLSSVVWHARFEKLCDNPIIISDGGHNPEGISVAIDSIRTYFGDKKVIFVTGVMADKDYLYMAERMSEVASIAFCVRPDNPRALSAENFAEVFESFGVRSVACGSVSEAIEKARDVAVSENRPIVTLGSLYMYEAVFKAVLK